VEYDHQASLPVRFARYVTPRGPGECWPWEGGCDKDGYGVTWDAEQRRSVRAHRVAWTLAHGEIPDGLHVLHRCDNPPCCNPADLFLGTVADNNADKIAKGRARGNETGNLGDLRRRLSAEQVAEIRGRSTGAYGEMAALGREYGVTGQHIRAILRGERR